MTGPLPGSLRFEEGSEEGAAANGGFSYQRGSGVGEERRQTWAHASLSWQMSFIHLCGGGHNYPRFTDKEMGTQAAQPGSSRAGI